MHDIISVHVVYIALVYVYTSFFSYMYDWCQYMKLSGRSPQDNSSDPSCGREPASLNDCKLDLVHRLYLNLIPRYHKLVSEYEKGLAIAAGRHRKPEFQNGNLCFLLTHTTRSCCRDQVAMSFCLKSYSLPIKALSEPVHSQL